MDSNDKEPAADGVDSPLDDPFLLQSGAWLEATRDMRIYLPEAESAPELQRKTPPPPVPSGFAPDALPLPDFDALPDPPDEEEDDFLW